MAQDGNTALLMAAKHGHADVLKLLLEAGADANIENEVSVRLSNYYSVVRS